jgi:methyl-accepting chemotaxis protein
VERGSLVQFTIARKLWLGFGTMLVLIGGIGYIGFDKAREARRTSDSLASLIESTQAVGDTALSSARTRLAANRFAAEPSDENEANYHKSEEGMEEALKALREKSQGLGLEKTIDELSEYLATYDKAAGEFIVQTKQRNAAFKDRIGPVGRALGQGVETLANDLSKAGEAGPAKLALEALSNANELRLGVARFVITNAQADYDAALENAAQAREQLEAAAEQAKAPELKRAAEDAIESLIAYGEAARTVHDTTRRADTLRNEGMDAVGPKLAATVNTLRSELEKQAQGLQAQAIESAKQATTMLIAGSLAAFIVGIAAAALIARAVLKPLRAVIDRLRDIAEGEADLTKRVDEARKDELGELGKWFNVFVKNMQQILLDVRGASNQVAAAATEIAASSEEMARGMEQQSGQVSQIGSAVAEMSSSVIEVAKKSGQASEQATKAGQQATEGGSVVEQTVVGMEAINEAVSAGATSVTELGKRGVQIGEIIKVINDIADQTNLLALNAAIEAARAGEHGRGFAVVADEVRKLAERTTKATEEVAGSIRAIQDETRIAVERMTTGTQQVEVGVEKANAAGVTLKGIVQSAKDVASMIQSIAAASEQQSSASEQISRSLESINSVTREATAGASQAAQASTELSSKAEELRSMVARFKLTDGNQPEGESSPQAAAARKFKKPVAA